MTAVPSPCTQVCTIDEVTGWCRGCRRSIDEIAAWGVLDDDEKRAVWAALPARGDEMATSVAGKGAA